MTYISADGTVGGKKSLWNTIVDFFAGTKSCENGSNSLPYVVFFQTETTVEQEFPPCDEESCCSTTMGHFYVQPFSCFVDEIFRNIHRYITLLHNHFESKSY